MKGRFTSFVERTKGARLILEIPRSLNSKFLMIAEHNVGSLLRYKKNDNIITYDDPRLDDSSKIISTHHLCFSVVNEWNTQEKLNKCCLHCFRLPPVLTRAVAVKADKNSIFVIPLTFHITPNHYHTGGVQKPRKLLLHVEYVNNITTMTEENLLLPIPFKKRHKVSKDIFDKK